MSLRKAKKIIYLIPLLIFFQNCSQGFSVFENPVVNLSSSSNIPSSVQPAPAVIDQSFHPTWLRPFSAQSPWNSHPSQIVFGTDVIPKSDYFPFVGEGNLSLGAEVALESDPPATIYGPDANTWIYVADAEAAQPSVTVPHWPSNVTLASGGDGHADIVDPANNRIHSFYQLRLVDGVWRSSQYTWTALDGRGWGTPGQYFQGSRAAGVVPMAGLIRKQEVNDGQDLYPHALAMSMTYNALAANPGFMFPATACDSHAASMNYGVFPEGALMMLPPDFDLSAIHNPQLLKIAKTLKKYGAYAVDENDGTPYVIYVEIGSGFNLMPNGWDNEVASEEDQIRAGMRQVVQASGWLDADEKPFAPVTKLNLLSMRGAWYKLAGNNSGVFDTWTQMVKFADDGVYTWQVNGTNRSMPATAWGVPQAGQSYNLVVKGSGQANMEFVIVDVNGTRVYDTGNQMDGTNITFTWPVGGVSVILYTASGPQGGGSIGATLIQQ